MMTDRAQRVRPSSNVTWWTPPAEENDTASAANSMRTPNFCAWSVARVVSSNPEMPAGKPR